MYHAGLVEQADTTRLGRVANHGVGVRLLYPVPYTALAQVVERRSDTAIVGGASPSSRTMGCSSSTRTSGSNPDNVGETPTQPAMYP